ncbi:MAG: 6-carboxytetrahydropterin synthase QueD [Bacteroidales bacterium]|jgi:6-pyruvoyltetrahydropterin/6-carboxytetrahydropterin synthase|nr:6-carboxytetrahydropterin synthase QueD [Bacteroidales bacterium]MCI1733307.1 6-carboxytetrahydropterin synthase QueD [Bacteroidales bacterium]
MAILRITKEFRFECAHALKGYDGKCSHIHGHSYTLRVTVKGEPISDPKSPKYGMVIDFNDLKRIVCDNIVDKFDHALVLSRESPLVEEISKAYGNTVITDFQPTSENLVAYFAALIRDELPEGVELYALKLGETSTSSARWYAEDNKPKE